ncbi:MAG: NPCBM/NEW2 domain-containing protein [Planctomycetota bacterium]|nr:NPCBM/NEW2 domain-containing protein [Planctomycetota bacterium]
MRSFALWLAALIVAEAATVVDFAGQRRELPALSAADLADADVVILGEGAPWRARSTERGLWLVDGSWLPVQSLEAEAQPDRLRVASPLGTLSLPLDLVLGWGEDLPAGDGDAVQLAGGLLSGRVLGIVEGQLRFGTALDPEAITVPLPAVRAARLAQPLRPASGLRVHAVLHPERPPLALVPVGDGWALAAAPEIQVQTAPLGSLPLRVEGGRRVYLSELEPEEVREEGAFGVVWPYQRDRGLHGEALRLGGQLFRRGLAVHSAARLGWRLGERYAALRALIGISETVAPEGDCLVRIEGDGRVLWAGRLRGEAAPQALDLPLAGVQRLLLVVELGERYDIGDHVLLADAYLVRR